ncbi:MAG: ATP synthase F1 subunit delta [Alphaproteobacteria bacterium]|nr:ATP synthase F1 subunit delta [Alphaproteobacteria bacterium]
MKKGSKKQIAKNYAKALWQLAETSQKKDRLMKDCHALSSFLNAENRDVVLKNPLLKQEQKKELVADVAKILDLSKTTSCFLQILLENDKLDLLADICALIEKENLKQQDIVSVEVETVQALSKTQEKKLLEGLEKKLRKNVLLSYKINENILGGLVVRYQSFQIDDSLAHKLGTLKQVMKG